VGEVTPNGPASEAEPNRERRRAEAAALARTRRRLFLVGTVTGVAAPLAAYCLGFSGSLWAAGVVLPRWPGLALYLTATWGALGLVSAPLAFYKGHVVQRRYGLSRQGIGGWLADWAKGTLLGLGFATLAGLAMYWALWTLGPAWWWAFGLAGTAAMLLLQFAAPYVLLPLFFKPKPLEDGPLKASIERLVAKAGTTVAGIARLDFSRRTEEANAAVIGYGRSRRVVLADTLLDRFAPDEIEGVVAHELGHHVHGDVRKLLAAQVALTFAGLFATAKLADPLLRRLGAPPLRDPRSLPLLLAASEVAGLAAMPLVNWWSRAIEASADRFAIRLTGDPRGFANALRRLADQNLAEERPPRWAEWLLYSHPPIYPRIRAAEEAFVG
jgi:STE24 endopeptidase